MRVAGLVALGVLASHAAHPDTLDGRAAASSLEASAFLGLASFGDSGLGDSWAPEQAPGGGWVTGLRASWDAVPHLFGRGLSLALEAELAFAASRTGHAMDAGRRAYFAPVLGWRAHAMLRRRSLGAPSSGLHRLGLFVLAGAGGATVITSSPFMADETDPLLHAGIGLTYALGGRWHLRADARLGVTEGRRDALAPVTELHLGLTAHLGAPPPRRPLPRAAPALPSAPADGTADRCATATLHGLAADHCPPLDPDGDGILGAADRCPTEPEDFDQFADDDGCPDPDNDNDGIPDAQDLCPLEPETHNGYADTDGCRDVIPAPVMRALAFGSTVKFAAGRARVTDAAKAALRPLLGILLADADLRIVITGASHDTALAKRRAEAVKWHLVDEGLAADRIETRVGPPARSPISLDLLTPPPAPTR